MALWGNLDSVYSDGTVNVNLETAEITGAVGVVTFTSAVEAGQVITVGAGATYGYAIITGVTSTTVSIASTAGFVSGLSTVSGSTFNVSEEPVYTLGDSHYAAPEAKANYFSGVFGIDTTEQAVANAASGDARKYAPAHAGWVGVTTYTDMHGNLRVKTETLVAGSSITGDAADDAQYPDV
jgi:hypothetical protein